VHQSRRMDTPDRDVYSIYIRSFNTIFQHLYVIQYFSHNSQRPLIIYLACALEVIVNLIFRPILTSTATSVMDFKSLSI
jgi:hypothetical protein